jgi:hypothetical protein
MRSSLSRPLAVTAAVLALGATAAPAQARHHRHRHHHRQFVTQVAACGGGAQTRALLDPHTLRIAAGATCQPATVGPTIVTSDVKWSR